MRKPSVHRPLHWHWGPQRGLLQRPPEPDPQHRLLLALGSSKGPPPEASRTRPPAQPKIEAVSEALDGCFNAEDIARTNVATATDTEALIAHYLEAELREAIGETRGCVGWPSRRRLKHVRGWLTGLQSSLDAARKRWCVTEDAREANRFKVTQEIALKALKNEERRMAFEARCAKFKEKHMKIVHEGTYDGPIVPIGMRPPEPPKVRNKKVGEAPKDTAPRSFLNLTVGAPEAASEGPSSSSSDACPEAPAPEAPAPEAPAPVAPAPPPSKGEEVKAKLAAVPDRLETKAYVEVENEFIAVATVDDLRPEDRKQFEHVKEYGLGLCSRCKWLSGCLSCDGEKAWAYACRNTLWHTASEGVRPKAKPRDRPKGKA